MSGHSKWATIKHKKGALDAKRGKIFTRLIKEITMAAKGGGDPDKNPRLRTAIAAAKAENMPADNIKRAIQRGTGELPGVSYEEFNLEGYGPGGVAILIELSTDNRNRTVSEIRHMLGKHGGNMGEAGSVAWMFHKKGDIVVPKSAAKEDDLMNVVLEAGADDLRDDGENWEILTDPSGFEGVLEAVKQAGIKPASAEIAMLPQNYIKLEGSTATQMIKLIDALEDHDDVNHVYSNFDVDIKQLEEVAG
jgi:YebC/PmpR family DNA-binding regulatory protein